MTIETLLPVRPRKWNEIWWDVWSHPGVAPFQTMLSEPGADIRRGFIWVAVTTFIITLISIVISVILVPNQLSGEFNQLVPQYSAYYIGYSICSVILSPFFGIAGLAISAGIYHLVARIFNGQGTWNKLAYSLAAVNAPGAIVSGLVGLISLLLYQYPIALFIVLPISIIIGIYSFILSINAVRAAERLGTGQAFGTIILPGIVFAALVACCLITVLIPVLTQTSGR